jgi:hypothetical protein
MIFMFFSISRYFKLFVGIPLHNSTLQSQTTTILPQTSLILLPPGTFNFLGLIQGELARACALTVIFTTLSMKTGPEKIPHRSGIICVLQSQGLHAALASQNSTDLLFSPLP